MELAVAELLARAALAEFEAGTAGERTVVVDDPLGGIPLPIAPVLLKALLRSVEEDNRIRRNPLLADRHARRLWTVAVMHRPRMRCVGSVAVKTSEQRPWNKRACGKKK